MTETTDRPKLATASMEVLADGVATEKDREWLRDAMLGTVWKAALDAGGVGIRDLTELKVLDDHGGIQNKYQQMADRRAAGEEREPHTVPPMAIAWVDATIVWPDA